MHYSLNDLLAIVIQQNIVDTVGRVQKDRDGIDSYPNGGMMLPPVKKIRKSFSVHSISDSAF